MQTKRTLCVPFVVLVWLRDVMLTRACEQTVVLSGDGRKTLCVRSRVLRPVCSARVRIDRLRCQKKVF